MEEFDLSFSMASEPFSSGQKEGPGGIAGGSEKLFFRSFGSFLAKTALLWYKEKFCEFYEIERKCQVNRSKS
jgi:hypothetical protein